MPESAEATAPVRGSSTDRMVDLAMRGLIRTALAMPYERRVPFMGGIARRVAGPLAGYRRRALANLAMIHPDWPEAQRREVADAALDNFGRSLIENYSWREFAERLSGTPIQGEGLEALHGAVAQGRPAILVGGHFGNYEAVRHVLTRMGFQVSAVYREMSNPYVNAHYVEALGSVSGPVFPRGRGMHGFVRHLAKGGIAAILFDLHAKEGVPIPFLGCPALTATTAAELALRYKAAMIPCFGIRQPDGLNFQVIMEAPVAHSTAPEMMAEATRRLEACIAAHPGQWFWVHRRWKGVGPQ